MCERNRFKDQNMWLSECANGTMVIKVLGNVQISSVWHGETAKVKALNPKSIMFGAECRWLVMFLVLFLPDARSAKSHPSNLHVSQWPVPNEARKKQSKWGGRDHQHWLLSCSSCLWCKFITPTRVSSMASLNGNKLNQKQSILWSGGTCFESPVAIILPHIAWEARYGNQALWWPYSWCASYNKACFLFFSVRPKIECWEVTVVGWTISKWSTIHNLQKIVTIYAVLSNIFTWEDCWRGVLRES